MRLFAVIILSGFIFSIHSIGQKLPFQNFGVDKGLIQSQVQCFAQDKQRHLWIGTFGGLDRFDGTAFKHFTKTEGLNSGGITCLYAAKNGYIWAGTFKGISCYDGFRITNYEIQYKSSSFNFNTIAEDDAGNIWAFNFNKGLFVLKQNKFIKAILPAADVIPTALYRNIEGQLIVNFHKQGIWSFRKNKWEKISAAAFLNEGEFIMALNADSKSYYAITNKKKIIKFLGEEIIAWQPVKADNFGAFCFDNHENIWIGTNKGVVVYNSKNLKASKIYDAGSGLSDNFIADIYRDAEDNMWVGTDGDGVFKFSGGTFSRYDNSNGLPGKIVMGIVNGQQGQIYLGIREGGLVKCNRADGTIKSIDYSSLSKAGINCMAADKQGNIFIGTMDNMLLKYSRNLVKKIRLNNQRAMMVNSIAFESNRTWIATSTGCYYIDGDSVLRIKGIDEITLSILPVGNNEILVGSNNGMYTFSNTDSAKKIANPFLQNAEINCLVPYHNYIIIGTIDDGLYFWERKTDKIYKCNSKSGLSDNQVFSIYVDSNDKIWAGSGTGIQQVQFDENRKSFTVSKFSKADGYENSENNLNTITEDRDNSIWIGTTKGAFVYSADATLKNNTKPYIVIQQVFTTQTAGGSAATKKVTPWNNLPLFPRLPFSNNTISFTVKGVYHKDPETISYSYQLAGYDTGFSQPVKQSFFNYQSLQPGNYIFRVKAITAAGLESENIAEYSFSVTTPFHKTKWFLILIICLLILTGILIQVLISKTKKRKKKQMEILREEEQEKVRQRTSEDFHDELGNKLTRIALLADILQKKVEQTDTEKSSLIKQIKENVQALYTGTKDVIWSLSSNSDNLFEILKRIEQFGDELFQDSGIDFSLKGITEISQEIKLPADYSRNMIMIFKELLNNSLRHAKASKVLLTIEYIGNDEVLLTQRDNGKGFDQNDSKKGNGLNNIQRRADRIGAVFETVTGINEGTMVKLTMKIPSKGG